ncbi:hypothetical protein Fcan01_00512 [Folsomia candida]|uniref:Uncharacterized protein n=1 Tax=Folsomia candida TaxID=158441 RepID=A0A226EWK8_FOLCA|nr:hypothetical protein Fcan01_00512 [Folsomia candida]
MNKLISFKTKLKSKISIPSLTPLNALKRCVFLSECVYPQFLTWNRITWVPRPTPRKRLLPAFLMTFLVTMATLHLVYFCLVQIALRRKDPDVTITSGFVLSTSFLCFTIAITISVSFIFKSNQLCIVLRNLFKLRETMFPRGPISNLSTKFKLDMTTLKNRTHLLLCTKFELSTTISKFWCIIPNHPDDPYGSTSGPILPIFELGS